MCIRDRYMGMLLKNGVEIDLLDKDKYSPLGLAMKNGNTEAVTIMLNANANMGIGGGPLGNPFHIAVMKTDVWLVKELLKRGVDPNSTASASLNTPLHCLMSIFDKFPEKAGMIAETLLISHADPNLKNQEGWAPLHTIIKQEQFKAMKWVVAWNGKMINSSAKFDLNLPGGEKQVTPLHLACRSGYFAVVNLLLSGGANPFARNVRAKTPRQSSRGYLVIFKCLKRLEDSIIKCRAKKEVSERRGNGHRNNLLRHIKFDKTADLSCEFYSTGEILTARSDLCSSVNKASSICLEYSDQYAKWKDAILNNHEKLHVRYNALNAMKKEKGGRILQIFKEIMENVLSISNVGLQMDIINSATIVIFPETIKTFEKLIKDCKNTFIKSILVETLEGLKYKILGNIKIAQQHNFLI
eukprot:TRINITY_DN13064_c0_g1_i10.p1 TRINITY_DN13064_c0_g1~~TRINITY_DN13064_c0_g1_i10.p1  ORF type:complete len:412 (+),score=98.42 TRINITY_DN13064_c0_g1_i10:77-1312(+)